MKRARQFCNEQRKQADRGRRATHPFGTTLILIFPGRAAEAGASLVAV
jgi:hypothetical protein